MIRRCELALPAMLIISRIADDLRESMEELKLAPADEAKLNKALKGLSEAHSLVYHASEAIDYVGGFIK